MFKSNATQIGLIADTHGLLRPEAIQALQGCELIIHAGDVGHQEILDQLQQIAPVVAIRGNIDENSALATLPKTAQVKAAGATILVLHDLSEPSVAAKFSDFQIVISGHTHRPLQEERNGILFINPGSAGRRRFRLPVCLARLNLKQLPWRAQFITLEEV